MAKNCRTLVLPYHLAFKAMAFSGMRFDKAKKVLHRMKLLMPPENDNRFHRLYELHKSKARNIDKDYIIDPIKITDLGLEPVYSWAQAMGDPTVCPNAKYIKRIVEESRHVGLRKIVDILSYLHQEPVEIAGALRKSANAPSHKWDESDIKIYQKFFWDVGVMSIDDWRAYASWADNTYQLPYVKKFPEARDDELLWSAGVPLNLSLDDMSEVMMRECYMHFQKAICTPSTSKSDALKFLDAFRKLYSLTSRKQQNTAERAQRQKDAIENVKIILDGSMGAGEPASIKDVAGQTSDQYDVEQNPVIDEMLHTFSNMKKDDDDE